MTIRQEILKQAEQKLDNYLERADEAILVIADDDAALSYDLCRILSTKRNTSVRQAVIRHFADQHEQQIVDNFDNQQDLPLDPDEETDKKESL